MLKKLQNRKMSNNGFSLVELIVVILIMAIIAVALAPQVMKWVSNSKITADQNAAGNLKSAVQTAVAAYEANGNNITSDITYYINGNTLRNTSDFSITTNIVTTGLAAEVLANLGGESYAVKYLDGANDYFTIAITATTGEISVTGGGVGVNLK